MSEKTSMKQFLVSRVHSFRHAFRGWHYALRTQRNAWIHSAIATVVFIVGLWLQLPPRDWAVIILTAALVFSAEFLNTSIEAVVDLASPDHHPLAKIGKDVGAAAVLVSALAAILIGILLLGPPLLQKLTTLIPIP
jgi:diacylglycerol kinase